MHKIYFGDHEVIAPQTRRVSTFLCPHWFPTNGVCTLVKNGILLPVYQHVTNYCLTGHYSSCCHYQGLVLAGSTDCDQIHRVNRRRSVRTSGYQPFLFSETSASGNSPDRRQEEAWTIDLSEGGIRFTCRQPLDLKTTLRFQLEGDNTTQQTSDTGRVVWCKPLADTSLFLAGMVFGE